MAKKKTIDVDEVTLEDGRESNGIELGSATTGDNGGDVAATTGGLETTGTDDKQSRKQARKASILERAKAKRAQRDGESEGDHGTPAQEIGNIGEEPNNDVQPSGTVDLTNDGSNGGSASSDGSAGGTDRSTGRGRRKNSDGSRESNQTPRRTNSSARSEEERLKHKGVSVGQIREFAPTNKPAPKVETDKNGEVSDTISEKEAKDFLPKIKDILKNVFTLMDMGITHTNKLKTPAVIWSNIDEFELEILAKGMVDMAMHSPKAASAVRQLSNMHAGIQYAVILGPRGLMTIFHYMQNGGFVLPFLSGMKQQPKKLNGPIV